MVDIPELTNGGFEDYIKNGVVLIDFFADWCMPCLMMTPILEDVGDKLKNKMKIGKVNIEDNQELAQKFNITSIPNFVLFSDGEVVHQFIGARSAEELEEKLINYF